MKSIFNHKNLATLRKDLEQYQKQRDVIIRQSRDIIKNSKQAIYSVHRDDLKNAEKLLKDAATVIKKLRKASKYADHIGAFNAGLEEYVEGCCFLAFVKAKQMPTSKTLGVKYEQYLLGISDLTGELGRRAVLAATAKNKDEVKRIRDAIDEIYGFFTQIDLNNGELRKKADSIKWNLKKVEDLMYDVNK